MRQNDIKRLEKVVKHYRDAETLIQTTANNVCNRDIEYIGEETSFSFLKGMFYRARNERINMERNLNLIKNETQWNS